MAIALRAASSAWQTTTSNVTVTLPTYAAGDLGIIFYGTKPYNDAPTIDQSWNSGGSYTSGTNGSSIDGGSMQCRYFWKVLSGSETNPVISNSTNSVSAALCYVFQPTSGSQFVTPTDVGGSDTAAGTSISITGGSNLSITTGDVIAASAAFDTDASGDITAHAFSATGSTFGTVSNTPTTDAATSSGQDMGQTACYAAVNSGPSSAAPVFTCTAAGSVPETAGVMIRVREELVPESPMPYVGGAYYGG